MKKYFYIKYAGIFLLSAVLVFISTFLYTRADANDFAITKKEELLSYSSLFIIYFVFTIPSWFISLRILTRFAKGKEQEERLKKRVNLIPLISLLTVFSVGIFWSYLLAIPNAIVEDWPTISKIQVLLELNYLWIIFPLFITYLLSSALAGNIKDYLYSEYNISFSSGKNKLWIKLLLLVILTSVIPLSNMILVTYGIINNKIVLANGSINFLIQIFNTFVCIILGLIFITKDLMKSVTKLIEAFKRIQSGSLDEKLAITANDEMGILIENFNNMAEGLNEREKIRSAFGQYVSKEVAEEIISKGEFLQGEDRTVTILFTDIEGYTSLVETLTPVETIDLLNEYYEVLIKIIKEYGGTVNKFIGDALMVMFNAPIDDVDHAIHAINCGEKIILETNSHLFGSKYGLKTRIGINTGSVIAGKLGGVDRFEYTLLGDNVNIAQRLEQLNKATKTNLLFSEETAIEAGGIEKFKRVGTAAVKGKKAPIVVYTLKNEYPIHQLKESNAI